MSEAKGGWSDLYKKEDWWAIWLALGIILVGLIFFYSGSTIKAIAVKPPKWSSVSEVGAHFSRAWPWYLAQLSMWVLIFTVSIRVMGHKIKEYMPGFLIIFVVSVLILVFSSWKYAKDYNLEAPLVALLLGLIVGNMVHMQDWLESSLRTDYYIKTGIVLLGATLPLTLILTAGPIAFLQATIVSLCTWGTSSQRWCSRTTGWPSTDVLRRGKGLHTRAPPGPRVVAREALLSPVMARSGRRAAS